MTQFQPPPDPHGPGQAITPPGTLGFEAGLHVQPWSHTAIAAFVCSLLGFLGVTALLGIVFGIFGLMATWRGQRRGVGFAIAAFPISVLTGALGALLGYGVYIAAGMLPAIQNVHGILKADSGDVTKQVSDLHDRLSTDFASDISEGRFVAWFGKIRARHGTLVSCSRAQSTVSAPTGVVAAFNCKFTNEPAILQLVFVWDGRELRLGDIDIDGISPRDAS